MLGTSAHKSQVPAAVLILAIWIPHLIADTKFEPAQIGVTAPSAGFLFLNKGPVSLQTSEGLLTVSVDYHGAATNLVTLASKTVELHIKFSKTSSSQTKYAVRELLNPLRHCLDKALITGKIFSPTPDFLAYSVSKDLEKWIKKIDDLLTPPPSGSDDSSDGSSGDDVDDSSEQGSTTTNDVSSSGSPAPAGTTNLNKRQILELLFGAFVMGTSIYSLSEIHNLKSKVRDLGENQELLIQEVSEMSKAIENIDENMKTLATEAKATLELVIANSAQIDLVAGFMKFSRIFQIVLASSNSLFDALYETRHGKLHPTLVDSHSLENSYKSLVKAAAKKNGFTPLCKSFLQLFDLPTTTYSSYEGEGKKLQIEIIIHVPFRTAPLLELFERIPFAVTFGPFMATVEAARYLALSSDHLTAVELSERDLKDTRLANDVIYFYNRGLYDKNTSALCNLALFKGEKFDHLCKITLTKRTNIATQIDHAKFLFATTKKITYRLVCDDKIGYAQLDKGTYFLTLNQTCPKSYTDGYSFLLNRELHLETEVVTKFNPLQMDHIFNFEFSKEQHAKAEKIFDSLTKLEQTSVTLDKFRQEYRSVQDHEDSEFFLFLVLGGFGIIVLFGGVLFAIYFLRKLRQRRISQGEVHEMMALGQEDLFTDSGSSSSSGRHHGRFRRRRRVSRHPGRDPLIPHRSTYEHLVHATPAVPLRAVPTLDRRKIELPQEPIYAPSAPMPAKKKPSLPFLQKRRSPTLEAGTSQTKEARKRAPPGAWSKVKNETTESRLTYVEAGLAALKSRKGKRTPGQKVKGSARHTESA